jgi:transcriptional regulator with XRE-family HTH domain
MAVYAVCEAMDFKRPRTPHYDDPEAVGRRLFEARERAGLSQRDLAFPGCSAAYISRIERGERIPSLQVMRELARRTGIGEAELAYGREPFDADVASCLRDVEQAEAGASGEEIAAAYRALARSATKAAKAAASR